MNVTQKYRRRLESMNSTALKRERALLIDRLTVNSNSLIRSSLNSRLKMVDDKIAKTGASKWMVNDTDTV